MSVSRLTMPSSSTVLLTACARVRRLSRPRPAPTRADEFCTLYIPLCQQRGGRPVPSWSRRGSEGAGRTLIDEGHRRTWSCHMRITITGGAGYVGSTLAEQLLVAGHEVRVLDRLLFG